MSRTKRTLLTAIGLALLAGLAATPAAASSKKEASYDFDQVWPAAVRFLRIDEGLAILEKDRDTGYVLFELAEDRKVFRGALEVVRIVDPEGRAAVRLVLRLEDRPAYMEAGILDRMVRKLRAELGPPPDPPPPPPPPAKPAKPAPDDGGAIERPE